MSGNYRPLSGNREGSAAFPHSLTLYTVQSSTVVGPVKSLYSLILLSAHLRTSGIHRWQSRDRAGSGTGARLSGNDGRLGRPVGSAVAAHTFGIAQPYDRASQIDMAPLSARNHYGLGGVKIVHFDSVLSMRNH